MFIDLHSHSTASDGTDSPAELVAAGAAAGLDILAITDHDSTDGWTGATAALPAGFTLLPGIELSCRWTPPGGRPVGVHLLGYLVDPRYPEMSSTLRRLRLGRLTRGRRMTERLAARGLPIRWDRVHDLAGDAASVGRPHLARALVEAGVVATVEEAFATHLGDGSPSYVHKEEVAVLDGVRLVRAAGGVPVFAHPLARGRGRVVGDDVVASMAAAGLGALEVDHPDHTAADRAHLRGLAADLGLLVTGSSDYHGGNKTVRLGAETTAPGMYEALLASATGATPIVR